MANDTLLEISSVTSNRATATLSDVTVYTSPIRSAVGVYTICQKLNASGDVVGTLTLTGNDADPQTDSSWEFSLTEYLDGWYRICYAAPEDYDAGTTYALYDAVQDASTSIIYRSKQAGNIGNALSNQTYWEVVDAKIALNKDTSSESENIDTFVYSVIITANAEYNVANAVADASDDCCAEDCSLDDTFYLIKLRSILEGAIVDNDRGNYPSGERKMRRLESITE